MPQPLRKPALWQVIGQRQADAVRERFARRRLAGREDQRTITLEAELAGIQLAELRGERGLAMNVERGAGARRLQRVDADGGADARARRQIGGLAPLQCFGERTDLRQLGRR
jgi:hypothetical protein